MTPIWTCARSNPELNLYNRQWPLRTAGYQDAPAKFIFDEEGRRGQADRFDRLGRLYPLGRHGTEFGARPRRAGTLGSAGGGFA